MKERLVIKDTSKSNYVIMRETPNNGSVIISATFTIKENAIKEVKNRIKRYRIILETGMDEWGRKINLEDFKKWGEPYLVELKLEMNKVQVE